MERREMLAASAAGLAALGGGAAFAQVGRAPRQEQSAGSPPLSADDATLLLVDHQVGLLSLVQDYSPEEFRNNVLALAGCGKTFNLPTILTTSAEPVQTA